MKRGPDTETEVSWPSKRVPHHYAEGFGVDARLSDASRGVRPADGAVVGPDAQQPGQAFGRADGALPFRDTVFSGRGSSIYLAYSDSVPSPSWYV